MKNKILVREVCISDSRIDYEWDVEGDIKECFKLTEPLFYEYSKVFKDVPKSIAVLPLLCNVLPIAWLYDAEIVVDEIDKTFYENLVKVKEGFVKMYPMLSFKGTMLVKKIVDNSLELKEEKAAVFFSGGVDSNFTMLTHLAEKPTLVSIVGADVALTDRIGIDILKKNVAQTEEQYNLGSVIITSSFRKCMNYSALDAKTEISHKGYWGGFQHGMAICSQVFPYAFSNSISKVYIASSNYAPEVEYYHSWGSAPWIDNNLRFGSGQIIHDGYYEYSRQDKVRVIKEHVSRTGKKMQLHVCWETGGRNNCSCCEKCFRTMFALLLEGGNPNDYGFNFTANTGTIMEKYFRHVCKLKGVLLCQWLGLQKKFLSNRVGLLQNKNFDWLETFDFSTNNTSCWQKYNLSRSIWKKRLRYMSKR